MSAHRHKILVAEDHLGLSQVLKQTLEDAYEVTVVHDARELERELQTTGYKLVVTDLHLPEETGLATLRQACRAGIGSTAIEGLDVPAIIITGLSPEDEEVVRASRMGTVKAIFHKPFDLAELRCQVEELVPPGQRPQGLIAALPRTTTVSILVVEENLDARREFSCSLEPLGYEVRTCGDFCSALMLCVTESFDAILLRYMVEGETAREFLERLHEAHEPNDLPDVFILGVFGENLGMQHFREFPAVRGVLTKPVAVEQLAESLRSVGEGACSSFSGPASPAHVACHPDY